MPRNKDLKRLVRTRMGKTGESYTAARAKVLAQPSTHSRRSPALEPAAAARSPKPDYAGLAGMTDAMIKARTGCNWARWVPTLDYYRAHDLPHREIAALVTAKFKVDSWSAQAVTVGYERIKGLRARGQRRDGTYEANKSRTFNVPVVELYEAWSDARLRGRWLDGRIARVRTRVAHRSLRFDGPDHTVVVVGFTGKGPGKSVVAVQHTKLTTREAAEEMKRYWAERLAALGDVLTPA